MRLMNCKPKSDANGIWGCRRITAKHTTCLQNKQKTIEKKAPFPQQETFRMVLKLHIFTKFHTYKCQALLFFSFNSMRFIASPPCSNSLSYEPCEFAFERTFFSSQ